MNRAVKHWMISAGGGHDNSLKFTSKDAFEKALRAHKEAKDETKSGQREEAAAATAKANKRMICDITGNEGNAS